MNREEKISEIKRKAQVFLDKGTLVFVKAIKTAGGYELRNGYIKSVEIDFFILYDRKSGQEIPIFFSELIKEGAVFEPSRVYDLGGMGGDEK